MNKSEILEFLKANGTCYLATAEGDKPHVRGMGIFSADEDGIIFHTSTFKDLYKQLSANPNVEMCFFNANDGIQVRVSGVAELLEDKKVKDELVAQRPFLKTIVEKDGYGVLAVYRLSKAKAYVWSLAVNRDPKTYVDL
jgi:uncharacterized pyridoxamine 5'-phosphate oxidase family protein